MLYRAVSYIGMTLTVAYSIYRQIKARSFLAWQEMPIRAGIPWQVLCALVLKTCQEKISRF